MLVSSCMIAPASMIYPPLRGDLRQDTAAKGAHFLRLAEAEEGVWNAAADREFVVQLLMHMENVVLVAVENNAAIRQFAEGIEVMFPLAFGIKEGLVALLPEFLDDRLRESANSGNRTAAD